MLAALKLQRLQNRGRSGGTAPDIFAKSSFPAEEGTMKDYFLLSHISKALEMMLEPKQISKTPSLSPAFVARPIHF